jgi:hypothetical protein
MVSGCFLLAAAGCEPARARLISRGIAFLVRTLPFITPAFAATFTRLSPASADAIRLALVSAAFCCGLAPAPVRALVAFSRALAAFVALPSLPVWPRLRARLTAWRWRKLVRGFGLALGPPPGELANLPRLSRV